MSMNSVWITGASSGIGKSLALFFADKNLNVIASSRNETELKNYLAKESDLIHPFPMNVSAAESVNSVYKEVTKDFEIDCLINNAGVTVFKPISETTEEELQMLIDTNLTGAIRLTQKVLPEMIKRKKGTIINILSVASETVFVKSGVYSASKAGLKAFAKVLREEVREYNIRVINIYPGATRTPIWPHLALENFGERMMSPEDIAKVVFDAYSNESSAVYEEVVLRPIEGDLE